MFLRLVALSALLTSNAAHAEGLLVTRSADVLGQGDCQADAQYRQLVDRYDWFGGGRYTSLDSDPELALRCGIGANTQLGLTYQRQTPGTYRVDKVQLQSKTQVWQSDNGASKLALLLGLGAERNSYYRGYSADVEWNERTLGLAFTQTLGERHRLHANFNTGFLLPRGTNTIQRWSTAYEFAATTTLALLAEAHGQDRDGSWRGVGLRWTPHADWDLGLMGSRRFGSSPWGSNLRTYEYKLNASYRF